jgi:hypothetical protein
VPLLIFGKLSLAAFIYNKIPTSIDGENKRRDEQTMRHEMAMVAITLSSFYRVFRTDCSCLWVSMTPDRHPEQNSMGLAPIAHYPLGLGACRCVR